MITIKKHNIKLLSKFLILIAFFICLLQLTVHAATWVWEDDGIGELREYCAENNWAENTKNIFGIGKNSENNLLFGHGHDLSLNVLTLLFGANKENAFGEIMLFPLPGDGGEFDSDISGTRIIGLIFDIFNKAALSLGLIIVAYQIIASLFWAASYGSPFEQVQDIFWAPMRLVAGIVLLLPKSGGYCLAQVMVMWLIVQGIGMANLIWKTTICMLVEDNNSVYEPALPQEAFTGSFAVKHNEIDFADIYHQYRQHFLNQKYF